MAIRRANDGSGMVVVDVTTTDGLAEKLGAILCQNFLTGGEVPSGSWSYAATGIAPSTSQTAVKAAAGAGVRNYVQSMQISHATLGAAVQIIIQDGSTTLWQGQLQTAASDAGGLTLNFEPALKGTANTAVNITFSAGTTGNVYFNLQGYTGS